MWTLDFKDRPNPISTALDRLMKLRNIHTFSTIAEEICVSPRTVSAWCYGDSIPNFINLVKLACYFDTSVDYLLGVSDIVEPENIPKSYNIKYAFMLDDSDYTNGLAWHNNLYCYSCNNLSKPVLLVSRNKVRAKLFLNYQNNT